MLVTYSTVLVNGTLVFKLNMKDVAQKLKDEKIDVEEEERNFLTSESRPDLILSVFGREK